MIVNVQEVYKLMDFNNRPKVSIIMPVYNSAQYIRATLDQIRKQDYPNYEVILIDDGSSDDTIEIVEQYSWVVLKTQNHLGVAEARNLGLHSATGNFIAFIDSDDFIDANYLSLLMDPFLTNSRLVLSIGRFVPVKKREPHLFSKNAGSQSFFNPTGALKELLLQHRGTDVGLWGRIFTKKAANKCSFASGLIFEDFDFTVRLLTKLDEDSQIVFLGATVYEYLQRPNSIMHKKFSSEELNILRVSKRLLSVTDSSPKEIKRALNIKLISAVSGVYARSLIDGGTLAEQDELYNFLRYLSKRLGISSWTSNVKTFVLTVFFKLPKRLSKIAIVTSYRVTKQV